MLNSSHRTCRRLAQAMKVALQIPDGDNLVFLIGSGSESSNLDALETWVKENSSEFEYQCGIAMLPHLLSRLEALMIRLEIQ